MGSNIDMEPNTWQWFVECAADISNGSRIVADGVTPYKGTNGREADKLVAVCGEDVAKNDKNESSWAGGIQLGRLWMSNEYAIGTPTGATNAHSIERMPEDECWDERAIREMKGTP